MGLTVKDEKNVYICSERSHNQCRISEKNKNTVKDIFVNGYKCRGHEKKIIYAVEELMFVMGTDKDNC